MDLLSQIRSECANLSVNKDYLGRYPLAETKSLFVPTRYGSLLVHLYRPHTKKDLLPTIVNFHGGAFIKGYRGQDIEFSHMMAYRSGSLYLDVDYKTAPEHPFPYTFEEGLDLLSYVESHAEDLGGSKNNLVLMGQSAGANLITGMTLTFLEEGRKLPTGLICCYPPCDLTGKLADKKGGIKDPRMIEVASFGIACYLPHGGTENPLISPLFASKDQLKGFPPVLIITAEHDILCDEALTFARHLAEAGTAVTAKTILGARHGFLPRRTEGHEEGEALILSYLRFLQNGQYTNPFPSVC